MTLGTKHEKRVDFCFNIDSPITLSIETKRTGGSWEDTIIEVVEAAAGNRGNGKEVMILLLNQRGDKLPITEEVVSIITRHFDKEVVTLLLDRRGKEIAITEDVVKAAAMSGQK